MSHGTNRRSTPIVFLRDAAPLVNPVSIVSEIRIGFVRRGDPSRRDRELNNGLLCAVERWVRLAEMAETVGVRCGGLS